KAKISEDLLDSRLKVNLYNEQIIFLLDSSYLQFRGEIYDFHFPLEIRNGTYYLPLEFLTQTLPVLLPDKISYISGIITAEAPEDTSVKTIVLDPGHGGKDPGAIGYSKKNFEKDIVLSVAKKLKKLLENNLSVQVLLTREDDRFVSLYERTNFANRMKADLFISIHCNAHRKNNVIGTEVYYLSTAKTDEARAVEALENSVVFEYEGGEEAVKKYDDLAFILADMAQNENLEESYKFALNVENKIIGSCHSRDRGVKQANFYVLRGTFMPSVLIELGFITNKEEEKKLINSDYQDKLAKAIFKSIKEFKNRYDRM
ncbi:MAG: N-acetylmuramoyl-L-alanine amidase, partial [Candidatus Cloacimonadota bacterium]